MCSADVTAISLVTATPRDAVCASLVPSVGRALSRQQVTCQRQPISGDYIDWVIDGTDQFSTALDDVDGQCCILLATRGDDMDRAAVRLTDIAEDLCVAFDAHTLFWNGDPEPIAAADFLARDDTGVQAPAQHTGQRRFARTASMRRGRHAREARTGNWLRTAMRSRTSDMTSEELESYELDERRATSVPMRLSAWMMSFATALVALPLAIPLMVHNLLRGEDVRSGTMALGVVCLYSALALVGIAPGLSSLF